MSFGLDNDGFTIKRETDIIAALEAGFKAEFGEINVNPASVFGQIIGVTSKPLAELWELMEYIYLSEYPASAEGISLDGVAQLTGILRLGPTKTKVIGIVIGNQGTSILVGNSASILETGEIFFTTKDVIIDKNNVLRTKISVNNVLNSQLYTVNIDGLPYTHISDATATATEILGGLKSSINSGQSKVIASVSDEVMIIIVNNLITPFTIAVDINLKLDEIGTPVEFEAQNTGSILAVAGSLTKIETPVSGWDDVDNIADGDIGNDTETDMALRIRRELSLRILGAATIPAITARLLQEVENVSGVNIIENDTESYNGDIIIKIVEVANNFDYNVWVNGFLAQYTSDATATQGKITAGLEIVLNALFIDIIAVDNMDGTVTITPANDGVVFGFSTAEKLIVNGTVPPHSIECIVEGGTDQAVANKIWGVKAGGIGTNGNTLIIIQDSEGDEHVIKFSRPIKQYAWASINLTLNLEEDFPSDGLEQVQANFQALGFTLNVGDDYILQKFYTAIYAVPGIANANVLIGVTDTPYGPPALVSINISILSTQVLDFSDIGKIDVNLI